MSARERSRFLTTAVLFLLAFSLTGLLMFRSMRAAAQSFTFRPSMSTSNTYTHPVTSITENSTDSFPQAHDANVNTAAITRTNADFAGDGFDTPDIGHTWSGRWSAFDQTAFFIRTVGLYVIRSGDLNESDQWAIEYSLDGASGPWETLDNDTISGDANPSKDTVSTFSIPNDFNLRDNLQVRTTSRQQSAADAKLNIFEIWAEAEWNPLTGGPEPLRITTTTLPPADKFANYDQLVEAVGGNDPYTWSIVSGSLPPEFNLESDTGRITYSAVSPYTTPGTYNFTVRVTDSSTTPQTDDQALQIYVAGLAIHPPDSSITALVNQPYSVTFTPCEPATPCGTSPYNWCLVSGTIPPGMSFSPSLGACSTPTTSPSITLSGTPSNAGIYNFTLRLTDSAAETVEKSYTFTVSGGTRILVPTLKKMIKGIYYGKSSPGYTPMDAQHLTAINVIYSNYSWSSTGLPAGLSLGDGSYSAAEKVSRTHIVGEIPVIAPSGDYRFSATIHNPPASSNTLNNIRLTVLDRKTLILKAPPSTMHLPATNILQFTVFAEGGVPSDGDSVLDGKKVPYYNYQWQVSPVADTNSPALSVGNASGPASPFTATSVPRNVELLFEDSAGPVTGTYDITFWAQDYLRRANPGDTDYEFTPATVRIKVIAPGGQTLEKETGRPTKLRQEQFR